MTRSPHVARAPRAALASATALACGAVLACAAVLALPAAGSAATVSVPTPATTKGFPGPPRVEYAAEPGEANRLTLTSRTTPAATTLDRAVTTWTFRDGGATITAGAGCSLANPTTATCTLSDGIVPLVRLGDGNDEATTTTAATVLGETGDDTLHVVQDDGPRSGELRGGPGDDLLDASLGHAILLYGDDGDDLLTGSSDNDLLKGGDGIDELRGGLGHDDVIGGDGPDRIDCGAGDDDRARLDPSDVLLDPNAPALGLATLSAIRPRATATATTAAETTTALRTSCEALSLADPTRRVVIDVGTTQRLSGGVLTLGRRASAPKLSYTLEFHDAEGAVLARGSLRPRVLRLQLTALGIRAFQPGSRSTVRLVLRRAGRSASLTRGPGVAVDLTIKD